MANRRRAVAMPSESARGACPPRAVRPASCGGMRVCYNSLSTRFVRGSRRKPGETTGRGRRGLHGACRPRRGGPAFLLLGFGMFVVTYGGGPLGFFSGSAGSVPWGIVLIAQTAFLVGTALGSFGVRFAFRSSSERRERVLGASAYVAATLACLALQPALAAANASIGTWCRVPVRGSVLGSAPSFLGRTASRFQ